MEICSALDFEGGRALISGIAGTGKTEILRQRSLIMREKCGFEPVNSLNLSIGRVDEGASGDFLSFVDFCHRFLSDHALLSPSVSRLNECDKLEIISRLSRLEYRPEEIRAITDCACMIREKELGLPEGLQVHRHANLRYRGLASSYIDHKKDKGLVDDDDLLMETCVALLRAGDGDRAYPTYDRIYVDDVQDASALHLAIIEKLATAEGVTVLFAGDEGQRLSSDADKRPLVEVLGVDKVFELTHNRRSSPSLAQMLSAYRGGSQEGSSVMSEGGAELPILAATPSEEVQESIVAVFVRQSLVISDHRVAVLARTDGEVRRLAQVMERHHLLSDRLTLSTVREAGRQDYDHVVVYNVADGVYPYGPTSAEMDARELYVAMSRAKQGLVLTYTGELSPFVSMLDPRLFYSMGQAQMNKLLRMEAMFVKFGSK